MPLYCIVEYHTIINVLLHIIMLHHNIIYHNMLYYMGSCLNRALKSAQNGPQNGSNFGSKRGLKRVQNGLPRPDTSSTLLWEQNQAFSIGFKGKTTNPPRLLQTWNPTGYHASRVSFYLIVPTTEAGAFRH